MGLTGLGYSSGGDILCTYDYANGGHWFFTEFVSTNPETSGGAFTGCFAGVADGCLEGIAVTVGSEPVRTLQRLLPSRRLQPERAGLSVPAQ